MSSRPPSQACFDIIFAKFLERDQSKKHRATTPFAVNDCANGIVPSRERVAIGSPSETNYAMDLSASGVDSVEN
jgi:hypothetical protein